MKKNANWNYEKFEDLTEDVDKSGPNEEEVFNYIEIGSINNNTKTIEEVRRISSEEASSRASRRLQGGDVLISRTRPNLNGVAVVPEKYDGAIGTSGFYVVRSEALNPRFVYYYAQTEEFIRDMTRKATGSSYPSVNLSKIRKYEVPIPDMSEQKDIVEKIDTLFSKLESGISGLDKTQSLLRRYKESTLNSAFDGRLTSEWRANYSGAVGNVETPQVDNDDCLEDLNNLPEIPDSWEWTTFEQVSDRVTVGHVGSMKERYTDEGVPFLRSKNVRENRFDPTDLKYIPREFHQELEKSKLSPGDLVVVRSGDVGVSCVIPESLEEANCADLVIVKQPDLIHPHLAAYYMNSVAKSRVAAEKVGVAQEHFNTKSMAKMPVPIPPKEEQEQLLEQIDQRMSVAEEVNKTIEDNLERADSLRKSILEKAFSGGFTKEDSVESYVDGQAEENSSSPIQTTLEEVTYE